MIPICTAPPETCEAMREALFWMWLCGVSCTVVVLGLGVLLYLISKNRR